MTKQTRRLYREMDVYTRILYMSTGTARSRILACTDYSVPGFTNISIGFVTVGPPRFDSTPGCPVNEDTTYIQRTPNTFSYMLSYMIPDLPYGAHR